jgi:hypothetical protein
VCLYSNIIINDRLSDQLAKEMEQEANGGVLMSATAPQILQNQQTAAAKGARVRFTGGGFAIK